MRLKLLEKYPKEKYPLSELREYGVTSVQGRSNLTKQTLSYLNSK